MPVVGVAEARGVADDGFGRVLAEGTAEEDALHEVGVLGQDRLIEPQAVPVGLNDLRGTCLAAGQSGGGAWQEVEVDEDRDTEEEEEHDHAHDSANQVRGYSRLPFLAIAPAGERLAPLPCE